MRKTGVPEKHKPKVSPEQGRKLCITFSKYLSSSTELFQDIFSTVDALSPLSQSSSKHHFVLHQRTHKEEKEA